MSRSIFSYYRSFQIKKKSLTKQNGKFWTKFIHFNQNPLKIAQKILRKSSEFRFFSWKRDLLFAGTFCGKKD